MGQSVLPYLVPIYGTKCLAILDIQLREKASCHTGFLIMWASFVGFKTIIVCLLGDYSGVARLCAWRHVM